MTGGAVAARRPAARGAAALRRLASPPLGTAAAVAGSRAFRLAWAFQAFRLARALRTFRVSPAIRAGWAAWAVILTAAPAPAAVLRVEADGRGAYPDIRAALAAARPGDVVELAPGTYRGPGNRDLDPEGKAVTVRSRDGDPRGCILDCRGEDGAPHRGFLFRSGEGPATRIAGLTIRGGRAAAARPPAGSGGAVYCRGASPSLEDCVFELGRATMGGALACEFDAAPRVTRCVFRQNTAQNGGGAHCFGSSPQFTACAFVGNTAAGGGALSCYAGAPRLDGCRLTDNSAHRGGAVAAEVKATPALSDCLLARNWATLGGGVYAEGAFPALERCTLAVNGGGFGGGVGCREGGRCRLGACVVALSPQGEGVACDGKSGAEVRCSTIWGNADGDWVGCLAGREGVDGNRAADPRWRDPDGGDYRPAEDAAPPGASGCAPRGAPAALCAPSGRAAR